jgi:hypothetical protein
LQHRERAAALPSGRGGCGRRGHGRPPGLLLGMGASRAARS